MNIRYAIVGCCFVAAATLLIVSANSKSSRDGCRNWSAFIPCVAKVEVNEPLDIGNAKAKQDGPSKRQSDWLLAAINRGSVDRAGSVPVSFPISSGATFALHHTTAHLG